MNSTSGGQIAHYVRSIELIISDTVAGIDCGYYCRYFNIPTSMINQLIIMITTNCLVTRSRSTPNQLAVCFSRFSRFLDSFSTWGDILTLRYTTVPTSEHEPLILSCVSVYLSTHLQFHFYFFLLYFIKKATCMPTYFPSNQGST